MGFWIRGGDTGSTGFGLGCSRLVGIGGAGEERQDRSMVSGAGGILRSARGCGDVRSRASTSGEADCVLRNRGDVRRRRVAFVASLETLALVEDDVESVKLVEALEDMEVSGGRADRMGAV